MQAAVDGDFDTALSRLSSTEVADGLLSLDDEYGLGGALARELLREHWTRCDAPGQLIGRLLDLFRRAGYVSDTEDRLTGDLTVYRGTFGDDPRDGISWTLDRSKAEWFAQRGARFADVDRSTGAVWQATVSTLDVLGYFTERDEAEVVIDPKTLRNLVRLA